ncbi:hypothetical protein TSUD_97390 [Trifolium subterraneum]|uniref:Retrovirus-related Pol polyprotein from transposon TNT 1-94-like beta-barrel domain-containing protein n=1 Tax=Trifolium subterraneum TaxID=3900 RepID=A0A2Z6LKX3_TRISU|nr:hypothetical protein TSUD_97390 [Trifolium subterraneum]
MATPSDSPSHNSSPDSSRPTPSPPPPPTSTPTHPALTVPNITNFIKITLSIEKSTYNTWSELFKIHARVFQVIDHIIPSEPAANPSLKTTDPQLWLRLDSVVLQWIYGTISEDLLNTIIEYNSTAETAWNRLFDIFYDNKNSRALYLEQEFSRTHMEQFSDASSYCQHLKSLSDQLANVGASVSEDRLVLQLISGLTDAYAAVGSQIRHAPSLPKFYKARSMIILEETALQKKATSPAENSSFIASQNDAFADSSSSRPNRGNNNSGRGRSYGRGQRGRSRGRNHGRGGGRAPQQQWPASYYPHQQWSFPSYPNPYQQWSSPSWQPWATPPCPYPTARNSKDQPGILGPRPSHQAHVANTAPTSSYAPTDIQAAMHTLSLSPPDDQWYMDTGATSHMTANGGNLKSYFNMSNNITVGSGHNIPVIGCGNASLPNSYHPLTLRNVLHAPKLIKNLISVRKFTIDNDVSIEFDPFGFSVKDFQTGTLLMRCNSSGDLYPVATRPPATALPPSTFAALSTELWHNRLGHPGATILSSLHRDNFLQYNKSRNNFFLTSGLPQF